MTSIHNEVSVPDDFVPAPADLLEHSVILRFEQMVGLHADRVAVRDEERALTYRALNAAANCLARILIETCGHGDAPIAFLLEHDISSIVTLMAILKAGRPYLALHSANPVERLKRMVTNAMPACLVSTRRYQAIGEELSSPVAPIQTLYLEDLDLSREADNPAVYVPVDFPFAIFYTSGSTGEPKGIVISHRYVNSYVLYQTNRWYQSPSDRISQVTSITFAASWANIMEAFLSGAMLCMFDFKSRGAEPTLNWIASEKISLLRLTPSVFRAIFDRTPQGLILPDLRAVIVSGEPAKASDVDIFKSHTADHCILINIFASTEAGGIANYPVGHRSVITDEYLPAGYPYTGKEILLLDEEGKQVPPGEKGEIVIKSRYLSSGYWGQPELTVQKFLPDPAHPEIKIFHTGDMGRWRDDGALEVLGRHDTQIKIRGYRIDVSEIESVLQKIPSVKEGIVVTRPSKFRRDESQLVAYVVLHTGRTATGAALRQSLIAKLPDYMLPTAFVFLDQLPLNVNGKVDKQALPEIPERVDLTEKDLPVDQVEERLLAIWEKVFGLEKIGVRDDYFELGGDSLMATHLLLTIEKEFSRKMPLTVISTASNIRSQAVILRGEGIIDHSSVLIPVQTAGNKNPIFCIGGKGGYPIRFYHLLKHLDADQPVYFFRSHGFEAGEPIEDTVEGIAADYLREIKSVQPEGPYNFLGESGGGLVAYEMAQRLLRQGEETSFLGMLDTAIYNRTNIAGPPPIPLRMLFMKHVQTLTGGGLNGLQTYLKYYLELARFNHHKFQTWLKERRMLLNYGSIPEVFGRVEQANIAASSSYVPEPYPGRVIVFRAERQARFEDFGPDNGWGEVGVGELIVHPIDCYHGNILFEPFVRMVAEIVNQSLNIPSKPDSRSGNNRLDDL